MNKLEEIGKKYGTDKSGENNYTEIYFKYFNENRNNIKNILEIGILRGESLKMWEEFFPNANIYGIDINDISINSKKIFTYIANQNNRDQLYKLMSKLNIEFDIIIDDGSHRMEDQQISLGFLFQYVKNGGYYIIEDIGTSLDWQLERFGINSDRSNTTYNMINKYIKSKKIKSFYIKKEEKKYLEQHIEKCEIYETLKNVSIISFFTKKI